jgi:hypothetical protein
MGHTGPITGLLYLSVTLYTAVYRPFASYEEMSKKLQNAGNMKYSNNTM